MNAIPRITKRCSSASRIRRTIFVVGMLGVTMLSASGLILNSRPHMAVLYAGLNSGETRRIVAEIQTLGYGCIYYKTGVIKVADDEKSEIRRDLIIRGMQPKS